MYFVTKRKIHDSFNIHQRGEESDNISPEQTPAAAAPANANTSPSSGKHEPAQLVRTHMHTLVSYHIYRNTKRKSIPKIFVYKIIIFFIVLCNNLLTKNNIL